MKNYLRKNPIKAALFTGTFSLIQITHCLHVPQSERSDAPMIPLKQKIHFKIRELLRDSPPASPLIPHPKKSLDEEQDDAQEKSKPRPFFPSNQDGQTTRLG